MIEIVPETKSTNNDLIARLAAEERLPEGYWLVADRQSEGKGRQGRSWLAAPGNFMGSTVVNLSGHDPVPTGLSFVAALAAYETALTRLAAPRDLQLKWPNDILLGGSKLAGILLERCGHSVVVGIGVNLAVAPQPTDRTAGHLAAFGPAPDRDAFARELANAFGRELDQWRRLGMKAVVSRWLAAAHPVGSQLSVHQGDGNRVTGLFDGLSPEGALLLRLPDGSRKTVHAGDISLEGS